MSFLRFLKKILFFVLALEAYLAVLFLESVYNFHVYFYFMKV